MPFRASWVGLLTILLGAAACAPRSSVDVTAERAAAPVRSQAAGAPTLVPGLDADGVPPTPAPPVSVAASPATPSTSSVTAPPPDTVAVPAPVQARDARRAAPWTLQPYYGLGAWLDAFDWSVAFARHPDHTIGLEAIDHMAAEGVETIYIQASRWNSETDVLEPERLLPIIDRAHEHGMAVVAWYLPTLEDVEFDLRRMLALAELDFDGFGVDLEARNVEDVAERNRRLLEVSRRFDEALGGRPLAAIVMEPVVMEDVNPNYWPGYPWMGLAETYDVWLPMSYWTNRRGYWRDAYAYTGTNIARVRERIGQPDALVHTIGGIGDKTTVGDLQGMVAAAVEHGAIGGSIYDYRTSRAEHWETLRAFRTQS